MNVQSDPHPERLYLQAARQLERSIQLGIYPVNSRLPAERELAETLHVSRPTVREAIIVLELRGLVQTRHGAGVYVLSSTPSAPVMDNVAADVGPFEVTEARRLFEGEAAALAATTISDTELAELEGFVDRMADHSIDQAIREKADRGFHLTLARATRNEAVVNVVQSLWDMRYRSPLCVYFFSLARDMGIQPPVDDHRLILEALHMHDPDAARQAMRAHLARVTDSLFRATEHDALERARLKVDERRHDFARRAGIVERPS
ncbi:FadR/GntR family transcriptional regulator [Sphingobium aquiterrae]|uniref:FadR/GntR family transcriptional regulator n=1 Tax=Sphingobium aquiterrae TaxID=2038656 RepID=UPI0030166E05